MTQIIRFKDLTKLNKKELGQLGAQHALGILDEGLNDAAVLMVQARKASEYIKAFIEGLDYQTRAALTQDPEGWKDVYGAELSLSSTGDRLAYQTDAAYCKIEKQLKDRKGLLDLAFKSDDAIYDADGIQVEKVKVKTYSKEMLKVKL